MQLLSINYWWIDLLQVRQIVDSIIGDALQTCFEWHPTIHAAICNKAQAAQAASQAAKAAREMVRVRCAVAHLPICYFSRGAAVIYCIEYQFIISLAGWLAD